MVNPKNKEKCSFGSGKGLAIWKHVNKLISPIADNTSPALEMERA